MLVQSSSDSKRLVLQKLARCLKFLILKLEELCYLGSEQQRCRSECTDAQDDLFLCWWHRHKQVSHDV